MPNQESKKSYEFFAPKVFIRTFGWQMDQTLWWRPSNVNSAIIKGIEANINYQPLDNLKTNFNYTYLDAEDSTVCKKITYRPRNTYKGTVSLLFNDKPTLFLTGRQTGKVYTDTANTMTLKGYWTADGNLTWKANDITEVSLSAKNIFDRDYEEEQNYPMPGASVTLGTKVKF